MPLLPPILLKPLLTLPPDPTPRKMHRQIAISVPHIIPPLNIRIELALRVDPHMVAHKLVLEHQVLDRILFGAGVFRAHEHGVIRHHFQRPAGKCRAAEESGARVDGLVVLRDEDVDFLDAEVLGRVDVCGVLF